MFASLGGFLILTAIAPLIIYYFFGKERRDLPVPSLLFWRNLLEGRPPSFKRRLVRFAGEPLFWIQIIFLGTICALLVGPITSVKGRLVVFILDTSASMGVREEEGTRLDLARGQVLTQLAGLAREHPVALVAVSNVARLVCAPDEGRQIFRERLSTLEPEPVAEQLDSAALLLRFLEARHPVASTHLWTDRLPPEDEPLPENLHWQTVGSSSDNRGIVQLDVKSHLIGEGKHRVRVWVHNGAATQKKVKLNLEPDGGDREDSEVDLSLAPVETIVPAETTSEVAFDLPLSFSGSLTLRLEGNDVLEADDRAYLAIPSSHQVDLRLALVSSSAPSPRLVSLGLLPGVEVVSGGALPRGGAADVLVREVPVNPDLSFPARPSITFLDSDAPATLRPETGTLRLRLVPWSPGHPVISGVLSERIRPGRGVSLTPPDGAEPLYRAGGACVAYALEEGVHRHVVFGFPASQALEEDAGILLLLKSLEWLHPRSIRPGSICRVGVAPPLSTRGGQWFGPGGAKLDSAPISFDQPGIYRVVMDEAEEMSFAVSLLTVGESRVKPAPADFPLLSSRESESPETPMFLREVFWRPLVPAAVVILVLEWLVFQRVLRARRMVA